MEYSHIGWHNEGKHDKVWGIIVLQRNVPVSPSWPYLTNKYLTFWGRRGSKLQTKLVDGVDMDMRILFSKKLDKGYREVDKNHLDSVYPEFEQDLEKNAIWATLKL